MLSRLTLLPLPVILALTAFGKTVCDSFGQDHNSSMDRRKRLPRLWFCCCIIVVMVAGGGEEIFSQSLPEYVPNLPYTAQGVHSYLEDGTLRPRETMEVQMRDSRGRIRFEFFAPRDPGSNLVSDKPTQVILYVPLQRQFIQLVAARKIAQVMTLPEEQIPAPGTDSMAARTTKEDLPGQMFNGIYALGTRTTMRVPTSHNGSSPDALDVDESWVSPDLKIVLRSKRKSIFEESVRTVWEIQKLDRSEPDPALFEIPADYTIVTETNGSQTNSPPGSSNQK